MEICCCDALALHIFAPVESNSHQSKASMLLVKLHVALAGLVSTSRLHAWVVYWCLGQPSSGPRQALVNPMPVGTWSYRVSVPRQPRLYTQLLAASSYGPDLGDIYYSLLSPAMPYVLQWWSTVRGCQSRPTTSETYLHGYTVTDTTD